MKKLKDNGVCQFFDNGKLVLKTKWKSKEDCETKINKLINISVLNRNSKPYKCNRCGDWHIGKPGEKEKYGKR